MKYLKWINEDNHDYCKECFRPDPDDIIIFMVPDDFDSKNIGLEQFFIDNSFDYENIGNKKFPNWKYKDKNHKRWSTASTFSEIWNNSNYKSFYSGRFVQWCFDKYGLDELEVGVF